MNNRILLNYIKQTSKGKGKETEEWFINNTAYLFQSNFRNNVIDDLLKHCKNVTDTSSMFYYNRDGITIDLSNFDTSNVTNMSSMFNNFRGEIIGLNNFDVSKVTSMNNMFQNSSFLNNSLDISNWNLANLTQVGSMFFNCYMLNETSLNNILKALPTATKLSTKTLQNLGLSSSHANTCTTLSNWQACVDAGWTTGY